MWSGVEGLCALLRRLVYPNRLGDLVSMFGRSVSQLSEMIRVTLDHLHTQHSHRLSRVTQGWVDGERFAAAVFAKGAALTNIWGFIDGTVHRVCRPTHGQRDLFSGHKCYHALKYQHVMCPNGLIVHSFGPFHGRRHDSAMYRESGIDALLQGVVDT